MKAILSLTVILFAFAASANPVITVRNVNPGYPTVVQMTIAENGVVTYNYGPGNSVVLATLSAAAKNNLFRQMSMISPTEQLIDTAPSTAKCAHTGALEIAVANPMYGEVVIERIVDCHKFRQQSYLSSLISDLVTGLLAVSVYR